MAGDTLATMNGYTKQRFGELQRLVPSWMIMQQLIAYESRNQLGRYFQEPLNVAAEMGATFQAQSNLGTIGTLNAAVPMVDVEAQVYPAEIVLRAQVAYGLIMQAQNRGPAAFGSAMDEIVLGLDESHKRFVEEFMLYGQSSIGTVGAVANGSGATNKIITITIASWAPGLWAQLEGCLLDIYLADGVTKRNANGDVTLTQISDDEGHKLSLTFASSTDAGNVIATDLLVFKGIGAAIPGASVQSFAGLDALIQNTGTMFGYDASLHNLLRGKVMDIAGAPLTMTTIQSAVTRLVVRGGYGKVAFVMSPFAWQDLADDLAALRRFASDEKKDYRMGPASITFWGTNGAEIALHAHPMVKCGDAFGFQVEHMLRAGASDVTNRLPGMGDDNFFFNIPDKMGCEIRNYSSQFQLARKPARNIKVKGIVSRSAPT